MTLSQPNRASQQIQGTLLVRVWSQMMHCMFMTLSQCGLLEAIDKEYIIVFVFPFCPITRTLDYYDMPIVDGVI